ncbi:MAG: DUF4838 domain-containing protein [Armatimonadota bacterium]
MHRLILLSMILIIAPALCLAAPRYRDLKVYTTSAADAQRPETIIAQTQLVNTGNAKLKVAVRLAACPGLNYAGGNFAADIASGKNAIWTWQFTPPAGVTREILTGSIAINGKTERDLFIAVQGPDPADFIDVGAVRITDRAQVTATYAPRARASVRLELAKKTQRRPALTLAADGKTDYVIALEAMPLPGAGHKLTASQRELADAVDDLQRCLRLQSGATLPLAATATGPAIILRLADPGAKELYDAYRLRTAGKNLIIESATLDGLRNGVYGLLTDHLDCHWFQPGQLGEEIGIPKDHRVRLPALNEVWGSAWFSTNGVSWGREPRWDRRLRSVINRGRLRFGHSWHGYINASEYPYEKFPEYYARDRQGKIRKRDEGWTSTNLCSTNPAVIEIVARKVNAYFEKNPDAIVASLDPNDYAPLCLCDRCLALDKQYGQTKEDGTEAADRLLHFSREIYDRLKPEYKDKFLGILVYGYQIELPKSAKAHPHHAGYICNMPWTYDHSRPFNDPTSPLNRHFADLITGWGGMLGQIGFRDYYGHWAFFGPWAMVSKLREDLPAFREMGGTYLILECQPNFPAQGLNHYIAGRLCWDIDADVDLLLEEFFTRYYGPAAEPMREYWLGAERFYNLERPSTTAMPRVALRPEFWRELGDHLAAAQRIASALPPEEKRFADRVQQACDGFEYGHLLFDYDLRYGEIPEKLKLPVDQAAARAYLATHHGRIAELVKKYPPNDPYWPMLLPPYLADDFEERAKKYTDTTP